MTHAASTQVQLVSRPHGWPTHENFRTVTVELGDLAPDEVRVAKENRQSLRHHHSPGNSLST